LRIARGRRADNPLPRHRRRLIARARACPSFSQENHSPLPHRQPRRTDSSLAAALQFGEPAPPIVNHRSFNYAIASAA